MNKRIFIISFFVLLVDIVSKRLVVNFMSEFESISIIDKFFSLTYVKNTGVAFSMIEGNVSLIVVITSVILFMLFKYIKDNSVSKIEVIGYSMVIGGAIGNLIDRVVLGYVIDFLEFNFWGYGFPVFNLADTFIVIGVMILILFGRNGEDNEVSSRKKS